MNDLPDKTTLYDDIRDFPVLETEPRHRFQFSIEFDQIFSALLAIVIAGGLYPAVILVVNWVFTPIRPFGLGPGEFLLEFILGGIFGFPCAAIYTFAVGIVFAISLAIFHKSTKMRFHPRILCQLLGGMTGFWCIGFSILIASHTGGNVKFGSILLYTAVGVFMGHGSATWQYHRRFRDYTRRSPITDEDAKPRQFRIWDIMVMMTWIAAATAVLSLTPPLVAILVLTWISLQACMFAIGAAIEFIRSKPISE